MQKAHKTERDNERTSNREKRQKYAPQASESDKEHKQHRNKAECDENHHIVLHVADHLVVDK